ncbi:MAG: hypothetical protein AAGF85_22160 [Bacteroidota bacterium]
MKQVTVFVIIVGAMLITACSEYESAKPDPDVDLNRAKAIWLDAQSKNGGGNNGRVVDQLMPLFEQYSQHLAHNDLPFLKIPVATQNKVVHHMEGVDTDLELGTYLLYVDNHYGENLYLVNVVLGEGNNFNNGLVTVHDLAGQYIVGYRFQDGEYLLVGEERETTQIGRSSGVECWYVDHYTCTVRIGPDDCELDYTTVHCEYYADKPRLIFGDGSGEGGGSGEGSSLTDPVQCDDGYFADEQGRCINTCGPSMVSDGNGGCVAAIIVEGPDTPIEDMAEYLKCFDTSQGATITIYADQPVANSDVPSNGFDPGHSFISISQNGFVRVFGFYPEADKVNPFGSIPSAAGDDSGRAYDVSVTINATPSQLSNVIYAAYFTGDYNLNTMNCTDYAINIINFTGLDVPDSFNTWPAGGGSNPGTLGQNLRSMDLPPGATRNTSGGSAPNNKKDC